MEGRHRQGMPHAPRGSTRARALAALVGLAVVAAASQAELSGEEYQGADPPASPAERARIAAEIEAERERAAMEARRRESEARRARERLAAQLAEGPPGERLTEARCSGCHSVAAVVEGKPRGPLGWRLTIERMRWWHRAALGPGEAVTIAAYLHERYPASRLRARSEQAFAALGLSLPFVGAALWWWRRRARPPAS
jgi:cytochrome c5